MQKRFTCANGHQWEAGAGGGLALAAISCPTCGAPAETGQFDPAPKGNPASPSEEATRPPAPEESEQIGSRVGPYKLLQRLGEGGMGVVYMAEQEHPVRRRVALKIIRPGMDSTHIIARFEAERQALALMDHPHIAKVLDAGTVGQDSNPAASSGRIGIPPHIGRPYFVMELVKGTPITSYCDEHRLPLRQRLELFIQVCQALQHAHQKGIIHRDVKPSNVLVAPFDGQPVVKVIDFGVAKAMGHQLTERTLFTQIGAVVGTLQYMSPEQAELNNLDIDTRSDIYSLGVLLYELLTGTTPLDKHRLRGEVMAALLMAIHEEEPPRPSTRLRQSKDSLPSIAAQRQIEPDRLTKLVRGDLDWIVMKALAKDRNRRYETANGLARDLQRYLADEPVEACPPSTAYKLRKFARKHKPAFLTAAAFAVVLVAALAVSIWQAVRATRAEAAAVQALHDKELARAAEAEQRLIAQDNEAKALAAAEAAKRAKETAEVKEAETRAVLDFLENRVFAAARPAGWSGGLGHDVTVRRALELALPFVENTFKDQPLMEARIRGTLGFSFWLLGEYKLAAEQQETVLSLLRKHRGPDHPDTLRSMTNLAATYSHLGREADALKLKEETLALQKVKLGVDHYDTLLSMSNLANSYAAAGRQADAFKLRQDTLALQGVKLGPDHHLTLLSMHNLASSYSALGRHNEAVTVLEQTLALREAKLGRDHPDTLSTMNNLANSYGDVGRILDGLKLNEEVLATRRDKLGPDHPDTLQSMNNLANSYGAVGRHEESTKLHEEALALRRSRLGPDHPATLQSMMNLANGYGAIGRHAEALKLNEQTLALKRARLGPDHLDTLMSMNNLANGYAYLGRLAEALKLRQEMLAMRQAKLGPDHFDTLRSMYLVGWTHLDLKNYAAAEAILLDRQTRVEKNLQNLPRGIDVIAIPQLIQLYDAWGKPAEAEKWRAKLPPSLRFQEGLERQHAWPLLWGWPRF